METIKIVILQWNIQMLTIEYSQMQSSCYGVGMSTDIELRVGWQSWWIGALESEFTFTQAIQTGNSHSSLTIRRSSHVLFRSPYERSTFRYTPLLPLLLSPIHLLPSPLGPLFGKLLFSSISSFIIPSLLIKSLHSPIIPTHLIWTLNPIILNINTRGSSESLLVVQILILLVTLKQRKWAQAGMWWALAVGWKIYPMIYGVSVWAWMYKLKLQRRKIGGMDKDGGGWQKWWPVDRDMCRFAISSGLTFGIITFGCWSM